MALLFYKWYLLCHYSVLFKKLKIDAINRHICVFMANLFLPVYYKLTSQNKEYRIANIQSDDILIGSLTSFPARIDKLWIVIESIMRQTRKPDRLLLWLSKEQFDNEESVPKSLLKLRSRGLEIVFVDDDLRSHKKYYYALKSISNVNLLTFDDDIIYPENAVEEVFTVWNNNKNLVVSRFASQIRFNANHRIEWYPTSDKDIMHPSSTNWIGSGGVTIYPASCFPALVLDKEVFMKGCKNADDVWTNLMFRCKGVKSIVTRTYCPLIEIVHLFKKVPRLCDFNMGDNNRQQLEYTLQYCEAHGFYPLNDLMKELDKDNTK